MLDLLITGGLVIDGSGNPGYHGAVGVEGERIRLFRGTLEGVQAHRTLDATGRVVAPGFIDMHAHSGLVILAEPRHEPKVRQGVTTEVIGIDGCSYAPFPTTEDLEAFVEINAGLDGCPPLPGRWTTVEQYLDLFTSRVAVNIVYLVGNSPLRVCAVGWDDRPARPDEVQTQRALLRTAMEEGAWGMSTGLDYPPGSYADTDELVALSQEATRLGGIYHTHVRYALGDRFLDPFREAIDIGRRADIPAHITHFYQRTTAPGGAAEMLGLVEDAREAGLDVTFDGYPYAYSSTRLNIVIPQWAFDGGLPALRRNLADPAARARMKKEMGPRAASWHDMWVTHFKRPEHHRFEGRSIAEVAELMGLDVVDAICELLLREDQQVSYVSAGANMATMPKFVSHPLYMVGSDAVLIGDYPSPRTYGAFAIILGQFVREEGWLGLVEAIRKMTSFPAQRLGLPDRGLLRDGFKADIVVFDAQTVKAPATRREPKQFAIGIEHVIVNGRIVVDEGQHTGALAGRALRRGRPST